MKKIIYSKPLARQWDIYNKERLKNETVELFFQRKYQKQMFHPYWSPQKRQSNFFAWNLWYLDATKQMLHLYFMDKNLKGFLENIKLADIDGIIKYINDNGLISFGGFSQTKVFAFGVHIPDEDKYEAFTFGLTNNELNQLILTWTTGTENSWCSIKNYKELLMEKSKNADEITKIFRFAINTIAYMEAFPECVKEGVPRYVKVPRKDNNFIIEISEKVLKSQKDDGKIKSPHFRKGYYKRLSSDFYKNKKGQIIFVSETMVNGTAKTVYTKENINKIDSLDKKI